MSNQFKFPRAQTPGVAARNPFRQNADPYAKREVASFNGQSISDILRGSSAPNDPVQRARDLGYQVKGGTAYWNQNGIPYNTPVSQVGGSDDPYGLDTPPILTAALLEDTDKMQSAADEQFAAVNDRISALDELIRGIDPRLEFSANMGIQGNNALLGGMSDFVGRQGADADAFGRDVMPRVDAGVSRLNKGLDKADKGMDAAQRSASQIGKNVRNVDQDVNAGYALHSQAVAGFQQAIANYKDTTAQDASSQAYAMRRAATTTKKQLDAAFNTGQIDEGTYQSEMYSLKNEVNNQVQANITPVLSRFNETLVSLEQGLAGLRMDAGAGRFTGAQIKQRGNEIGLAAADLEMRAASGKADIAKTRFEADTARAGIASNVFSARERASDREAQMFSLAASVVQNSNALREAAALNAVNLQMQGLNQTAQFVTENPRTVVSWFQGLLAMFSARAASTGNTRLS